MVVRKVVSTLINLGTLLVQAAFGQGTPDPARDAGALAELQDTADLQARASARGACYAKDRQVVRLTIGIGRHGRRWVGGFGPDRPEAADTPAGRVLYEIGSITKVFTGTLLARAEVEGRVRLDTKVGDLLPRRVEAPEAVRAITLGQLSTHTSGLPRLPANLFETAIDAENPYRDYHRDDLFAYLRTASLRRPAGTRSDYSNLGAGLLGDLLALDAGRPYEALVREAIAGPLRMADTTITLSADQRARLVGGRAPGGRPVSGWDFDAMAPAGALHSTVDDLLTFLGANIEPPDGPLGRALRRTQEVHFGRGQGSRVGLGWQIRDDETSGRTIHWHNGGTGGYRSFLGFVDGERVGIVLLSNTGDAMRGDDTIDRIGFDLLRLATRVSLAPDPAPR